MQKLWQKKLKLSYTKNVFDIIQFGSSIMEGAIPNDIDIAIIFQKIPLKKQLTEAQKIKKQLKKFSEIPIHVISFDLYNLLDNSNFARSNILFHGKSIIFGSYFTENFGLTPTIQIYYSLKKLEKKEKIKFNYLMNGKKGKYGLLRNYKGKLLKPGLIEISPEYEEIFAKTIKKMTSNFKIRKILS